ncbi:endonuclease domain-containing protein [Roseiconus nitratireducens]|uniref:endonuclease domain-containing protein n=1 Tax=Roseiconus nitratireducens TaxID=2605748 RepID=UPI001F46244B|nr:endonuclease domain-containing protein [Roseiconus nitratireducens]
MINSRDRRRRSTKSEGLLWSILRSKQLCVLKFRREHPVGPFIVDFACVSRMLVVEVDGGYHDQTIEADRERQELIEQSGWQIIRFTDREVEDNAEAVARAIANHMGIQYEFNPRSRRGSGNKSGCSNPRQK